MSKSLLQQLYDGEVYPAEAINPKDADYRALSHALGGEKEYFREALSPDDRERFNKLDGMYHESTMGYSYAHFTYGFRLGVRLMIEALASGEGITLNKA